MEQVTGLEPASLDWKSRVLAARRHLHGGGRVDSNSQGFSQLVRFQNGCHHQLAWPSIFTLYLVVNFQVKHECLILHVACQTRWMKDSNPRGATPDSLATSCLKPLSQSTISALRAPRECRTPDLSGRNRLLCPLSYRGIV